MGDKQNPSTIKCPWCGNVVNPSMSTRWDRTPWIGDRVAHFGCFEAIETVARTLAHNLAIGAALCRAWQLGYKCCSVFPLVGHEWRPGCGRTERAMSGKHPCTVGVRDNAGWIKNVLMWDWMEIAFANYPGWEIDPDTKRPHTATLTSVKGRDRDAYDIAVEWDDIAESRFHWSEWMDDGHVFCRQGDTYHARFDFQTKADRDRFVDWVNTPRTRCERLVDWVKEKLS